MKARQSLLPAALFLVAVLSGAAPRAQEDDPVYVDEEKKEFLDKVERCRTASDWKGLFELQTQAAQPKKAHKLVRLPGADARYVGLIEYLNRRFADLPPEALQYYRDQFDGPARLQFDRARAAGDRSGLERVVDTWFYSSRTDEALDLLANLHVEEGRLPSAVHCWGRLLYHYPDSEIPRAVTAARLARAAAASGNESGIEGVRRHVKEKGLAGDVIVGDAPVGLQSFLDSLKVEPLPGAQTLAVRSPSIVEPGGPGDARLTGVRPEIRRWDADLTGGPDPGAARSRQAFTDFPYLPAYGRVGDHEMVVYSNGLRVTVLDPERANFARRDEAVYFSYPPPGEAIARPQAPVDFRGGGPITWVRPYIGATVDGEHAFATLYSGKRAKDAPAPGGMGGMQDTLFAMQRLVCLNLRTQQVAWDTDFGEPGNQLRKLEFWDRNFAFSGPPLVRGDRLYVGVCSSPLTEEESRVLCLDRRTGLVIWERFLASVSSARPFWAMGGSHTSRLTILEEDRGVLVAHTNLGAVAALDAVTGQVRWLSKYPRLNMGANQWGQGQVFARPASPIVLHRGRMFALPQDAAELLVVDLATGAIQKEAVKVETMATIGARQWRDFQRLVGRMGDYLVLGGAGACESCVLSTTTWNFYGLPTASVSGTGRGSIDGETLYLPSMEGGKGGLGIFHGIKNWSSFERSIIWWPLGEGGNVVRAGNYLLFTSSTKISLITDSEVVRAEFRRRLEQSPPNPAAWLEYGELMKENFKWSEAARGFLSFIEAVEGDVEWMAKARDVRTGLHGIFLKLGMESSARKMHAEAAEHYRRARDFAWDVPTLTESTRLLAGACESVAESHGEPAERRAWARRAVEEYQELIRRSPQGFIKPGEPMLWIPTRQFAAWRISLLVKKHGADATAGVEFAASEDLKRAGNKPESLKAVADLYPGSEASIEALERIAKHAAGQGRWTAVAGVLREMRDRLDDRWTPARQKRLHEALEKSGDAERLEEEIARMERLFEGTVKFGPEENSPTVAEYLPKARAAAAALQRRAAESPPGSMATLSTWEPAAEATGMYELGVGWDLVLPGGLEPARWPADHEFFARGSSIELWNIRTKKRVWTAAHPGGWTGLAFSESGEEGRGVRVTSVVADSPASRAGFKSGDVIRLVDGAEVNESTFDLATEGRAPGTKLAVDYKRGDEARRTELTPVAWPASSRPGIVGAVFTADGSLAVAWDDLVGAFDPADGKSLWVSRPSRARFALRSIHAATGRILVHEHFTADRCRSAFRLSNDRGGRAPFPPEDLQSRIIGLDEMDGDPVWAAGFRIDLSTAVHHSVRFLGRPLDNHVSAVVSGYQGNMKSTEIVSLSAVDGKEGRRIPLTGTGGQPASAWILDPSNRMVWVMEVSPGFRTLKKVWLGMEKPADFKEVSIRFDQATDPGTHPYAISATATHVAVVSLPQGMVPPRVKLLSALDGTLIAEHQGAAGALKDRIMPTAGGSPEMRLIQGLVTLEEDGTVILYNEAKPAPGAASGPRRAFLTALRVSGGKFERAWEAVSPTLSRNALADRDVLTVRSGPKGLFVTTWRGIPPGKSDETTTVAFHSRKEEGAVRKLVDDLLVPMDVQGVRRDPAPAHKGRIFLNRKGGLEILGD